jgi:hypothetical protein
MLAAVRLGRALGVRRLHRSAVALAEEEVAKVAAVAVDADAPAFVTRVARPFPDPKAPRRIESVRVVAAAGTLW